MERAHQLAIDQEAGLHFADSNDDPCDSDVTSGDKDENSVADDDSLDDARKQPEEEATVDPGVEDNMMDPEVDDMVDPGVEDEMENTGVGDGDCLKPKEEIIFVEESDPNEGGSTDSEVSDSDSREESSEEEDDDGPRSFSGRLPRPAQRTMSEAHECQHFQGAFGDHGFANKERMQVIRNQTPERDNCLRAVHSLQVMREQDDTANDFALAQHSLRQGLVEHGDQGKAAAMKEMRQMVSWEVCGEAECESLSSEDERSALAMLLFPTMRQDGSVKGCACADGRKQRTWMQREDAASPTPAAEASFCAFAVDAAEGRCVATCDLPGHFLQTNVEGFVPLQLDGDLAKTLAEIEPGQWGKHLQCTRGRPAIFVRCQKAIHGTLNAAPSSHRKLTKHLEEWG